MKDVVVLRLLFLEFFVSLNDAEKKASKLLIKLNQRLLSYNVRSVWVITLALNTNTKTHKKNYFGFLLAFKRILRVSFSFFFLSKYLNIWIVIVETFLLSESPSPLVNDFKVKIWVCFSGMKKKLNFIYCRSSPTNRINLPQFEW